MSLGAAALWNVGREQSQEVASVYVYIKKAHTLYTAITLVDYI